MRDSLADHYNEQDGDDDRGHAMEIEGIHLPEEDQTEAPRPDQTEDGGAADIDFPFENGDAASITCCPNPAKPPFDDHFSPI